MQVIKIFWKKVSLKKKFTPHLIRNFIKYIKFISIISHKNVLKTPFEFKIKVGTHYGKKGE